MVSKKSGSTTRTRKVVSRKTTKKRPSMRRIGVRKTMKKRRPVKKKRSSRKKTKKRRVVKKITSLKKSKKHRVMRGGNLSNDIRDKMYTNDEFNELCNQGFTRPEGVTERVSYDLWLYFVNVKTEANCNYISLELFINKYFPTKAKTVDALDQISKIFDSPLNNATLNYIEIRDSGNRVIVKLILIITQNRKDIYLIGTQINYHLSDTVKTLQNFISIKEKIVSHMDYDMSQTDRYDVLKGRIIQEYFSTAYKEINQQQYQGILDKDNKYAPAPAPAPASLSRAFAQIPSMAPESNTGDENYMRVNAYGVVPNIPTIYGQATVLPESKNQDPIPSIPNEDYIYITGTNLYVHRTNNRVYSYNGTDNIYEQVQFSTQDSAPFDHFNAYYNTFRNTTTNDLPLFTSLQYLTIHVQNLFIFIFYYIIYYNYVF